VSAEVAAGPDDTVLVARNGGVLWVTLNRPQAANALTPDQRNELIGLLETASGDHGTRVVVLAARGRHFCSGADLSGGAGAPLLLCHRPDPAHGFAAPDRGRARLRKAGRGRGARAAAGIGAHLAMACDSSWHRKTPA